jgi:tRNA(Ile)-lysidine synthase
VQKLGVIVVIVKQGPLPGRVYVACSGGVDSMAVLDFLRRKRTVEVLHFNHGNTFAALEQEFVSDYCARNGIVHHHSGVHTQSQPTANREEWWRNQRYSWFDQYTDAPVITCHHLDDCVETWIWSSLNGTGKIIPYRRKNVIRPFRLTRKNELKLWCATNSIPWIEDPSNQESKFTRNYIRNQMMPHVLRVNPGIHTVVRRKIKADEI